MSLKFHEISESLHRILNPLTPEKLNLLGELCDLSPGIRQLDLASGNGEMLCQWAARFGITGVGVDLSSVFVDKARRRSAEMKVEERVTFKLGDAADYARSTTETFDVVSCVGATWIGGGLVGTLELMKRNARGSARALVVGEPFWREPPPDAAIVTMGDPPETFTSLHGTLERLEAAGLELVEMVLANEDDWDRYEASQWAASREWLQRREKDPLAAEFRKWIFGNRRFYLQYGRRYFGWGVFVLR